MPVLQISFTERAEILYALGRTIRENNETIKTLSEGWLSEGCFSEGWSDSSEMITAIKIQNQGLELLFEKIKTVRTVG